MEPSSAAPKAVSRAGLGVAAWPQAALGAAALRLTQPDRAACSATVRAAARAIGGLYSVT